MLGEVSLNLLDRLKVIPAKRDKLLNKLYEKAIERLNLTLLDYLTIRDLVELSDNADLYLHAILLFLFDSLAGGSLCIPLLKNKINEKLLFLFDDDGSAEDKDVIDDFSDKIFFNLNNNVYNKLISSKIDDFMPIIKFNDHLYFQKSFIHEKSIEKYFKKLLERKVKIDDGILSRTNSVINEVIINNPVLINSQPMKLNDDQKSAILLAIISNFLIISGGPGTGKTSIIFTLLRVFTRLGFSSERIFLAAPTGRAAKRISDSINFNIGLLQNQDEHDAKLSEISSSTIHRLLKFNPSKNDFVYNKNNFLPLDILIIDEVSMVDVFLMSKLLEAVDLDHTKVIFLGDKDQLPSVEAGTLLANLIPEEKSTLISQEVKNSILNIYPDIDIDRAMVSDKLLADKIVILKESYRSNKGILSLVNKINEDDDFDGFLKALDENNILSSGMVLDKNRLFNNTHLWVNAGSDKQDELYKTVDLWIKRYIFGDVNNKDESYGQLVSILEKMDFNKINEPHNVLILDKLFAKLGERQILTVVKDGPFGCNSINRYIEHQINHNDIFSGMPILITRNDYTKGIYNGDIGIIIIGSDHSKRVLFNSSNGKYDFHFIDAIKEYESAFAITVHKSQGSEYENVFLLMPSDKDNLLVTKEILYTGITRAKKSIWIYSNEDVLRRAFSRKVVRESGMNFGAF